MTSTTTPDVSPNDVPPPRNQVAGLSLVCAALGCTCIPIVMSVAAVILGFAGLRRARVVTSATGEPVGGGGMAGAGIMLGLVGLVAWGVGGYHVWGVAQQIRPMVEVSTAFIKHLNAGDIDAARGLTTGEVPEADLKAASEQIRSLGVFRKVSIERKRPLEFDDVRLTGRVLFEKGARRGTLRLVRRAEGYRVAEFKLEPL